jgi:hypothetical protein
MRIDAAMILVVFFLLGFSLVDLSTPAMAGNGAGGYAAVGKSVNPPASPEVSAGKERKPRGNFRMKREDVT